MTPLTTRTWGGPYRAARQTHDPMPVRAPSDPLDRGGLALLVALVLAGSLPVVGCLFHGSALDGEAHVGFTIALGALILAIAQLRRGARRQKRIGGA